MCATSTNNLEKNTTGIIIAYHNQPFRVNQNANNALAIIDSNWREENHSMIQITNHEGLQ